MTCNTYAFGSEIHFAAVFTSKATGDPADPTDVILKLQRDTDAPLIFTYSGGDIERLSTGNYFYNYLPTLAGAWRYSWEGTGAVEGSTFNIPFTVLANLFGP